MSRYHQNKEQKRLAAEASREKDTIYYVLFQKKTWTHGSPSADRYFEKITVLRNPETCAEALNDAIAKFQQKYGVSDWREIASEYTFDSLWYP